MSELENITKLTAEFPLVFARGIRCASGFDDGWYPLIRQLCADIEKILAGLNPEERAIFRVSQIKEKFGGLVFSTRMQTTTANNQIFDLVYLAEEPMVYEQILDLVSKAEERSRQICEVCGEDGARREGNWIRTLCDTHANGAARYEGTRGCPGG